ncbi:MAG: ABC transporter substrate-binding protein [Dehalococcoidia bacterium]|nr:ABC transporter substrate-binding protein [Dehalococcoidia bacterium]
MTRNGLLANLLIGLVVVATACAPTTPTAAPAPAATEQRSQNQVLRFARAALPQTASPESTVSFISTFWAQFDTLVMLDKEFNLRPSVATRWEFLPNDEGWRFFLRNDVFFPNGERLTAADVEFTFNHALTANPPVAQRTVLPALRGVRVVDEFTVDLLTRQRDSSILYGGPYVFIYPRGYYQQVGREVFTTRPMGSGPYELVEFRAGDQMIYRLRTDANRRHPFRQPIATELRWRAVPEASALLNGVRLGEIDVVVQGLAVDQVEQARREGLTVIPTEPSTFLIAIIRAAVERENSPLQDIRVRQALNYAIDRETIVRTLYRGLAQPWNQAVAPDTPAADPTIPQIPFNQQRARELLAQAGYPNGFRIRNGIDYVPSASATPVMLAVQDYWRQIGVQVELNALEQGVWLDKYRNRGGQQFNELISAGGTDATGIALFQRSFLTCNQPLATQLWCVPGYDELMDRAYAEPDTARRVALLREATRLHTSQWPYIYLIASQSAIVSNPKIRGLDITTGSFWRTDSAYRVD